MNQSNPQSGFTLIELIIAITISSMVLSLVLVLFNNTTKGVLFQNQRAEKVQNMIICKKKIDSIIKKIKYTTVVSETNCNAITNSDSLLLIQLQNQKLLVNNVPVCTNVAHFLFTTTDDCQNKVLLFWECSFVTGGWIGGVQTVYSGEQK